MIDKYKGRQIDRYTDIQINLLINRRIDKNRYIFNHINRQIYRQTNIDRQIYR